MSRSIVAVACVAGMLWSFAAEAESFPPRMSAPDVREVNGAAEQAAYATAMCVYNGMTEAGSVLSGATKPAVTEAERERIGRDLAAFQQRARAVSRSCFTESEIVSLGRLSFLEDMAFADGSGCRVARAPALRFERTPNNVDGDIVNAATRWQEITSDLDAHPFFRAQAKARDDMRKSGQGARFACRAILDEFGPTGWRISGLVRPGPKR